MNKFMTFDAHVQSVFENDENKFNGFMELLNDATVGMGVVEGLTKKEVNDEIVSRFRALIGCDEKSNAKEVRRAIRRNKELVFDLLEEKGCTDGMTVSIYDFEFDYVK